MHKSAKANLLEAGLGGTINIRTRRPFDNGGERILAANAIVTDDGLSDDNGYNYAAVYSDTWNDELGFLVSVAGDERVLREDWISIEGLSAEGVQQRRRFERRSVADLHVD